jgi:hypothetical protein
MEEPDVKFLVFLTITISLFDGQIFNYKKLALDTKIGDPTKTGRYCEIHQGYYLYLMVCNSDSYY